MKRIVLTGRSAIEFWRSNTIADTFPVHDPALGNEPLSRAEIQDARLSRYGIDGDNLHLLVGDAKARRKIKGVRFKTHSERMRKQMLRMTADEVYVVAPELCFLEVAAAEGFLPAIQYGFEICGSYATGSFPDYETVYDRPQLTNIIKLEKVIKDNPGARGVEKARRALHHIVERSASPMETTTIMLLCMPLMQGGYGLPLPNMNERFNLDDDEARFMRSSHFRFDLHWPEYHLVIEYNSDYAHDNDRAIHRDAFRNNIITSKGTTVFVLTWESIWKVERFDKMAHMIAAQMGKRIRGDSKDGFIMARKRLRGFVMPSLRRP